MKHAAFLAFSVCLLWGCSGDDKVADAVSSPPASASAPATLVPEPAAGAAGLAGSSWRLVEMQSMDDAQGTSKPSEPDQYLLTFGVDGRVTAKMDCNRGTGPWKAVPASDTSGSIEIGPLATTRALCPQPSLGESMATQLGFVRGYLLKDGRLNLSLMADGGILIFEPAEGPG